jgi:uncharacterized protein YndB with AHSA1/START domain
MDASLTRSGERYTLTLERRLPHSPAKVWRVVTERKHLHQWFPAHVIGEWKVGAELRFEFQHGEGDQLSEEELRGEVLAVDPERLLEFRWGKHILRCELKPDEDGCRLLFSENLDDASVGARNAAGWEWCLQNLERLLEGGAIAGFALDAWRRRFEHYVAAFQPQFGHQQGPPETHRAVAAEKRDERNPG